MNGRSHKVPRGHLRQLVFGFNKKLKPKPKS
ncbi:unnamed protein product, partial [Vitis vinifera]